MNRKIWTKLIVSLTLIFVGLLLIPATNELSAYSLAELVFHMRVPLKGANTSVVWEVLRRCVVVPAAVVGSIAVLIAAYLGLGYILERWRRTRNPAQEGGTADWKRINLMLVACPIMLFGLIYFADEMQASVYIKSLFQKTTLYDERYLDPKISQFTFPEKKRNLILIVMESMENTYASRASGGDWTTNLIPRLTQLAEENASFTSSGVAGGMEQLDSTGWTIGGLVGLTAGIPLNLPVDGNSYSKFASFLPGAVTLMDILADEGYNQTFLLGSDISFGGRDGYYNEHGNVNIWDYNTAIETRALPKDYYQFWGYEDSKLYHYAKQQLAELSAQEAPFHLTMLTVDTHFFGGYICPNCAVDGATQYERVISCADQQVYDFIQWAQEQPFYEDTAIAIVGDHLSMDASFFEARDITKSDRQIYNCYINHGQTIPTGTANRSSTSFDVFPTVLAALGVDWGSERLALGTNLFSGAPTLVEELGLQALNAELAKRSAVYTALFMED